MTVYFTHNHHESRICGQRIVNFLPRRRPIKAACIKQAAKHSVRETVMNTYLIFDLFAIFLCFCCFPLNCANDSARLLSSAEFEWEVKRARAQNEEKIIMIRSSVESLFVYRKLPHSIFDFNLVQLNYFPLCDEPQKEWWN